MRNSRGGSWKPAVADGSGFNPTAANGVGFLPISFGVIGHTRIRVVDGHALQAFLGSELDFQVWFMGAVRWARLKRGEDYQRAGPPRVNPLTGRSGVHVVFAIKAAEKIAMMSSGPRGNAVRTYFIKQADLYWAGMPPLPFLAELQQ
jgi:phage anti-repressor protein